ncbi:MAG: hypothetical protein QOE70_4169 [Chthoniobacter sp.]|jgi:tetratricopeptide (TPR) repeat protein|nr:hypothetical protein [Chthoniobacter sp.]
MRKRILLCCWLLTPVILLAYHYGPGQSGLARDEAAQQIARATSLEQSADWRGALAAYSEALAKLPADDRDARWQVRLAQSKARMHVGELPEANNDLENLLAEMQKGGATPKATEEVRANLATGQYYAGWLMRLEGASTEEWTVQTDSARQHFRLLAEDKLAAGAPAAKSYQEDLEATIRLARMDLTELQGLPLPKMCQGCKNVSQKCRGQCQAKAKKPAEKEPKDARKAGTGERPRGGS